MLERYRNPIFIAIIAAIGVGVVVLLTYRPAPLVITINPPAPTGTPAPSATPGPIRVYVSGSVNKPEVYTLPPGSRVQDALNAAGGASAEADLTQINLARVVRDGEQILVPNKTIKAADTAGGGKTSTPSLKESPVRINTATLDDLQRLPGIGAATAQKIIDYRNENGPFKSMQDLDKIPGIGAAKIKEWDGMIVFD